MSLVFDWLSNVCSFSQGAFFWICDFIECQLDLLYLGWVLTLLKPALLTIFILPLSILLMLYFSSLLLYIYTYRRTRMREVLHESLNDPWVGGRYLISLLWDAHGYIWHGYDVQGLEHMPSNKGGLIVYYHGAIPLDVYYLVARLITSTGQHIHCVGDRFLQKIPGWQSILEAFHIAPCSVSDCVRTVSAGHLLAVSPGGVREAQFSDHSYALLWGSRMGFAKVAIQANCPIIPMFSKNLREAFRVVSFPSMLWNGLYSRFKLPFAPIYGGFPVKLVSYLGPCIYPLPGETAEHLAGRVERAVYRLIAQHQRLPGNILAALLDRLHPCISPALLGPGAGTLPPHAVLGESGQQQDLRDGEKGVDLGEKGVVCLGETEGITKSIREEKDVRVLLKTNVEHDREELCVQNPSDKKNAENLSGRVLIEKREQTRNLQQQQYRKGEIEERMQERIEQVLPAADSDDRLKSHCQEKAVQERIELIQPLRRSRRTDGVDAENRSALHLDHEPVEHLAPFAMDDTSERFREDTTSTHFKIDDACYLETPRPKETLDAEDLPEDLTLGSSTSCHDEVRGDCAAHFKSLPSHTLSAALTEISPILCSQEHEDKHKFSKDIEPHVKVSVSSREEPCITLASGSLMGPPTDANSKSLGEACKSIFDDVAQPFEIDLSKCSHVAMETSSKGLLVACLEADDLITDESCHQRITEETNSTANLMSVQSLSLPLSRSDLQGCVEGSSTVCGPGTLEGKIPSTSQPMMLQDWSASIISHHDTLEDRIPSVSGPETLDGSEVKELSADSCSSGGVVFAFADRSSVSLRSRVECELIDAMQPLRESSVTPDSPTSLVAAVRGFVKLGETSFSAGVLEESSNEAGEFESVAVGDDSVPSTAQEDGSSSSGGHRDGSSDSSDGRSSGSSFELLTTIKSSSLD